MNKDRGASAVELMTRQYISLRQLEDAGLSRYRVNRLVERGDLARVNRRYYENLSYRGEANDFYAVEAYAQEGVVCLLSAAAYHGLTLQRPPAVDVAIPRASRKPSAPEWPPMRFYFFSAGRYERGITTIEEQGGAYRVYDREKTVCDVVFYRNKLGFEPALDVMRSYMARPDRNLNRLMDYARALRVETSVRRFAEVLA